MSQFLVLYALIAVAYAQLVDGQLVPLPTLPPITIPPITLPPITLPPLGGVVPALLTVCPAGYFAHLLLCYPCPYGSTSASGDLTCSSCATGFYAPGPGSSSCTACSAGYTSSPAHETCVCGGSTKGKGKTGNLAPNGANGKGNTGNPSGGSSTATPIVTFTNIPIVLLPIVTLATKITSAVPIVPNTTIENTKGKGKGKGKQ